MEKRFFYLLALLLLMVTQGAWAAGKLTTDTSGAYFIKNATDWETFCNNVNNGTHSYSGETVKLKVDISSSTIVGTEDHPFSGTFDGDGHTLTVNISYKGSAAPFGRVGNITIKNLHVAGSVRTTMYDGADHTSGLIGRAAGVVNIENVRVSATVTGHTYYGGFIGNGNRPGISISTTITMTGCVFDGTLTENTYGSTQHAGGFIGWGDKMKVIITDCLFAGTSIIANSGPGKKNFHPVGYYCKANDVRVIPVLTNVYYTVAPSAQNEDNNGVTLSNGEKQAYSITTTDANVTTFGISGAAKANYTASGLKRYANGIMCGSTLYACSGDMVNLTLAHADASAGQHFTGYTVSGGGSLNDATSDTPTFTMTAANQTIVAEYADNTKHYVTLAEGTETGWSINPSGMAREGEPVTVSYQGEHKVKRVTVKKKTVYDLSQLKGDFVAKDGDVLTGRLTGIYKISIADGATVTLRDVDITNERKGVDWAGINCPGDATLILEGDNKVCGTIWIGTNYYPGIWIAQDKTLTIKGNGSLTAEPPSTPNINRDAPGIGARYMEDCGNIDIQGGTIIARGGHWASGIGCAYQSHCGVITIRSTVTSVTAIKGEEVYDSIGEGYYGWCEDVIIEEGANVIQK